ncbi:hypothetical protein P171DRAFT_433977 [Karstenula rhodostoma CBS 690.94]|uniref:Bacteriophage T5 Orf172 DNA-binding domain-containing protein n=1 Tax=Karstenula rhodostoma CBS 690.94 TaxID=1392251 RepID=A0A9P4U8N4_9PLEO|nr:hypothetical protein P171DRAFT_433977 [Karstenula rhodostoma CBS 690.94]
MSSRLSPPVPHNPSRRFQHDLAPPPKFNLYDKQRDATSSANEFTVLTHQESRNSRSQSTPNPVQQNLEKTLRSELSIKHDKRRPSLTKKPRSAPGGTANVGASISNDDSIDDSIQTPHLQNNRVPSLCGKQSYSSPGWRKKHEASCAVCRNINLKETSQVQVCDTTLDSKRQATPESEETRAPKAIDEQLGGTGGTLLSVNREALEDLESGRDRVPSLRDDGNDPDVVHVMTLGLEDEANPDGSLVANSSNIEINATELHNKVRAVLEKGLTPNDSEGYIYILSDPKRPDLHKIGRSKETIRRKRQLKYQCGLTLRLVKNVQVDSYCRAERLIQTYLLDLCRPYRCEVCGASHGEWFEIAAEPASAAVSRWASYMTQENPYDPETRQLRPFTKDLVKRRDHFLADANSKIETTREHWNRILSPTSLDRFRFKFTVVWDFLWKFYWPVNTIFAWTVAFVVSRHPVTFLFMAASVVGTFISMSDEHHLLRNDSKSSKKKSV